MHRRGIIIAAIVLVVGFLLPSDDTPNAPVVTREAQLDIQSQSQPPTEEQLRAQLVTPQNDPDQVAPVAPEPIRKASQKSSRKLPKRNHSSQIAELIINGALTVSNPVKRWRSCSAHHGLPATDVYAMAQVEGAGKPLSNLQNGQDGENPPERQRRGDGLNH